jgi:hypothetical protein
MPFEKGAPSANPKGTWKKGTSGNPNGRTKKAQMVGDFLRGRLLSTELRGKKMPGGMTVAQALADQIIVNAFQGDANCIREILRRYAPVVEYAEIEVKSTGDTTTGSYVKYTLEEIKSIAEVLKDAGFNADLNHRGPLAVTQSTQATHEAGGVPLGGEEPESA